MVSSMVRGTRGRRGTRGWVEKRVWLKVYFLFGQMLAKRNTSYPCIPFLLINPFFVSMKSKVIGRNVSLKRSALYL